MNQLSFSNQSMSILNGLSAIEQIPLIETLSNINPSDLKNNNYPSFKRDKKNYYRIRQNDLRIYFTLNESIVYCEYILNKHSITDFAFRANLPIKEEHLIEQDKSFWEYLDSLQKKEKNGK